MTDSLTSTSPTAATVIAAPVEEAFGMGPVRAAGLRRRTARGTLVNAGFMVTVNSLSLVKGFAVAALLSRSDYGIWGILVTTLGALLWVRQVGVGDKYVQQDEDDQELAFQRAFTLELLFTLAVFAVMAICMPLLALAYGEDRLVVPGILMGLLLPAAAFQTPQWIFYRNLDFVRQRSLQAVEPVLGFGVTIALAVAGLGYWSLVAGAIVGAWGAAVVAVRASPFPLRLRYDRGALRRYSSFSWPMLIAGSAGIITAQGSFLTGQHVLGLAGVGAMALAAQVSQFADRLDSIITTTLYPAVCAVRDRTDLLYESFIKSNRLALVWAVPFGVGLALFAPDLVTFGLGEKWATATILIQAFGLTAAAHQIGFNWAAFYMANGRTRPMAVAGVAAIVTFGVVAIPLLVNHGLGGFAIGIGVMEVVNLVVRSIYLSRLFPAFRMAGHMARAIAPTVPAAGIVLACRLAVDEPRTLGLVIAELVLYGLVTVGATIVLERSLLAEVLGYLRGPRSEPVGSLS